MSHSTRERIVCDKVYTALKSSWNLAGVEPGDQEGPGCEDLGRVLVLIEMPRFVRDDGTNQTT